MSRQGNPYLEMGNGLRVLNAGLGHVRYGMLGMAGQHAEAGHTASEQRAHPRRFPRGLTRTAQSFNHRRGAHGLDKLGSDLLKHSLLFAN